MSREVSSISGSSETPPDVSENFITLVYDDLRKLAAHRLAQLAPGQTLQPTALVHEAWLRLEDNKNCTWENRAHFFAAAAEAMRRVVVDYLRGKSRIKRGGGCLRLDLDSLELAETTPTDKVLLIHEALERLEAEDSQKARVVVLKFFGGLTDKEVAVSMGISERTIERHWAFARAWLLRAIREDG